MKKGKPPAAVHTVCTNCACSGAQGAPCTGKFNRRRALVHLTRPDVSLRGRFAPVAISGRHFQFVQGADKTYQPIASVAALSERLWQLQISACFADRIRHCRGAACRSRCCTCSPYRPPSKWHAPIASVAAFPAQPLAALPPYGCGVPFTGVERLVGVIQRQQGTGAPRHSLTCHCEAPKWPWQSRRARLNHWKAFGENATAFPRLQRAQSALAMTNRGRLPF